METLSTGVSTTLKKAPPRIPPGPALRERHLKSSSTHLPQHGHLFTKPNPSIPHNHRPTSCFPNNNNNNNTCLQFHSTSHRIIHPPLKSSPPILHRNPAVGYAAALLDVALSNNALHVVQRDVRRFLKLLQTHSLAAFLVDASVDDRIKGEALKEIAHKGMFQKHLVVLLNMLVNKSKVGMASVVLEDFQRMYHQFIGPQVVFVSSSDNKLDKDKLLGIAESEG